MTKRRYIHGPRPIIQCIILLYDYGLRIGLLLIYIFDILTLIGYYTRPIDLYEQTRSHNDSV